MTGRHDTILARKPLIGISSYLSDSGNIIEVPKSYIISVKRAGGIPVILPPIADEDILEAFLNSVDGIIMVGGEDIDPLIYGEQPIPQIGKIVPQRDEFDLKLIRKAAERGMPVLGICRGEQAINVAFGGSLYQDIYAQMKGTAHVEHSQKAPGWYGTHSVYIKRNSLLYKILKSDTLTVNSFHHQAVKAVAPGFAVTADAPDGVVEAIEKKDGGFIIGVQFHPEKFVEKGKGMPFMNLFEYFIRAAGRYGSGRL
jgi:putative glutamine amidotransferase